MALATFQILKSLNWIKNRKEATSLSDSFAAYLRLLLKTAYLANELRIDTVIPYQYAQTDGRRYSLPYQDTNIQNEHGNLANFYLKSKHIPDEKLLSELKDQFTISYSNGFLKFIERNFSKLFTPTQNQYAKEQSFQLTQTYTGIVDITHKDEFVKTLTELINHINQFTMPNYQQAKIKIHQISPHLFNFIGTISSDSRPLLIFSNLNFSQDPDSGSVIATIDAQSDKLSAFKTFSKQRFQIMTTQLDENFTPTNPQEFWKPVLNVSSTGQVQELTDQQLNLLNHNLAKSLARLINFTSHPEDSSKTEDYIRNHIDNLFGDTNTLIINPETIEMINWALDKPGTTNIQLSDQDGAKKISEITTHQYPGIMKYLSSYI